MRSILRSTTWLRWRSGLNLSCIDRGLVFVEVGMTMLLIVEIYRVYGSIAKCAHSRRILGVNETTFMLEIWLMYNIHQNKIEFNKCKVLVVTLSLNHKKVYVINRRKRIHEQDLSSNNKEGVIQAGERINGLFLKSMFLSLSKSITMTYMSTCTNSNGRWDLRSSHNYFNSIKYSITYLESWFRILMVEHKVKILTWSTLVNRSCRSLQASNAWPW